MANKEKRTSSFMYTLRSLIFGKRTADMTVADERYDSPSKLTVKRFFRKPLAVIALIVLVSMFLFVFIGPIFDPIDINYTEVFHKNVAPNMSMMKLPSAMKDSPVSITSKGTFTLGLDKNGNVHVWGYYATSNDDPRLNVMIVPDEVKDANILFAAAGTDHCIAISDKGEVFGWGQKMQGQYDRDGRLAAVLPYKMPLEIMNDGVDVANVKQLICGTQMTAILMKDGTMYAWGNSMSSAMNLESMFKLQEQGVRFEKICFTNAGLFAISTEGEFLVGNNTQYQYYNSTPLGQYINGRKVVDIAASGDTIVLILEDGEFISMGTIATTPEIPEGEEVVKLSAASRHFTVLTNTGRVIAWGNGKLGQTEVPSALAGESGVDQLFSTGFQNYAFKDGKFVDSWGLKGYIMGTDAEGRDVFNRVMNGGRMTMTIGAVAVIVASIIGIIIGCISGYFGGLVDLILMRVAEIFSAIPFLPFALVLSAVLQGSDVDEDTKIFIIMIILGLLSWTGLATLVRGQILAEREKEFVIAAKSMGIKERRIAFKHILPNIISVILVNLTLNFASCMLTESSLSYLGFGVKLPRPTWGNMLDGCRDSKVIQNYWWRWVFPALFLAITVICINIIGDTLRDILDPKSEVEK